MNWLVSPPDPPCHTECIPYNSCYSGRDGQQPTVLLLQVTRYGAMVVAYERRAP